jgi:hypothetical protein
VCPGIFLGQDHRQRLAEQLRDRIAGQRLRHRVDKSDRAVLIDDPNGIEGVVQEVLQVEIRYVRTHRHIPRRRKPGCRPAACIPSRQTVLASIMALAVGLFYSRYS